MRTSNRVWIFPQTSARSTLSNVRRCGPRLESNFDEQLQCCRQRFQFTTLSTKHTATLTIAWHKDACIQFPATRGGVITSPILRSASEAFQLSTQFRQQEFSLRHRQWDWNLWKFGHPAKDIISLSILVMKNGVFSTSAVNIDWFQYVKVRPYKSRCSVQVPFLVLFLNRRFKKEDLCFSFWRHHFDGLFVEHVLFIIINEQGPHILSARLKPAAEISVWIVSRMMGTNHLCMLVKCFLD